MLSLNDICYSNMYSRVLNNSISYKEALIFLNHTFINRNYLFIPLLTDILSELNKQHKLDTFFELYTLLINYMHKEIINRSICNPGNNPYFKHYAFGKILLYDLPESIVYRKDNQIPLIYATEQRFKSGENVISSSFKHNFCYYTQELFTDDFNWSNCIIAGGSIYKILGKNFMDCCDTEYNKSDIDIFVYGQTKKKKEKVRYLINYFITKLKKIIIINKPNVLTIYSKYYHRDIQIIVGNYRTPLQILNDFDLSHLQLCYNGTKIQMTPNCFHSFRTQTTSIMKYTMNENLYKKIKSSGMSLVYKNEDLLSQFILMENEPPDNPFSITDEFRKGTITEIKNNVSTENNNREDSYYSFHAIKNGWCVDRALCVYNVDFNMFKHIYLNFSGSFGDTNFYMTPVL